MAHIRMWAGDYTLSGLVGFELRCKTVGILGMGAIGAAAARIFCVSLSAADLLVLCLCSATPILVLGGTCLGPCRPHRASPSSLAACELLCKTAGIVGKRAAEFAAPPTFCAWTQFVWSCSTDGPLLCTLQHSEG